MAYSSNIKTVITALVTKLQSLAQNDKMLREIATTVQSSNQRRIHNEGKAVNGSKIGDYDKKPMYVNPKNSPKKFTPKGKTGKSKFKSGKLHTTRYFDEGYKGFRGFIGRPTDGVNLQLSGKLFKEFVIEKINNGYDVGFASPYGTEIRRGQEKHYAKKIWGVTKQDHETIKLIEEKYIRLAFAKH